MLVIVFLVFIFLILFNFVFFIFRGYWDYKKSNYQIVFYLLIYQFVFVFIDLNYVVNFYLYFFSGKKFCKYFISMLCCVFNIIIIMRIILIRLFWYQMFVILMLSNYILVEYDLVCSCSISNMVIQLIIEIIYLGIEKYDILLL